MKNLQFRKWLENLEWENKFKKLLKESKIEEKNNNKEKLKSIIKSSSVIFFFEKDGEFFAGPEESRVIFAKLKKPDEDVDTSWEKEASFMGINLSNILKEGNPSKRIFYKKDMKDMKILDKEEIEKKLLGDKNV